MTDRGSVTHLTGMKLDFASFADFVNSRVVGGVPIIAVATDVACLADFWPRIATNAKEAS